jgi:hypothetical protein
MNAPFRFGALVAALMALTACDAILGIRVLPAGDAGEDGTGGSMMEADASTVPSEEAGDARVTSMEAGDSTIEGTTDAQKATTESAMDMDSTAEGGLIDSGPDSPACTNACTKGLTQCAAGAVQSCQTGADGCAQWETTSTCGTNQTCTVAGADAGASASCTCKASQCTQVGTLCQNGQTLATCAKDLDGCLVASPSACPVDESCGGTQPNALCATVCQNSCTAGQTSCVDGDLAKCTLGSNGCYSYGTPMACGTHQSCTGAAGSAGCTCNSDPVCKAAGNVCTSLSASATCSADGQGCIYQSGSATCTNQTCVMGVCAGVCGPGQTTCGGPSNAAPETCNGVGQWASGSVTAGRCGAVCNPGTPQPCVGPSSATPQTCNSVGQLASGSVTAGQCGAVCNPGTSQACTGPGSATPQTCNSVGQRASGSVTAGQCGAVCNPGTPQPCTGSAMPQTCNSVGQLASGSVTVGQCGAVCNPGATRCVDGTGAPASGPYEETCNGVGQWGTASVMANACGAACTPGATQCCVGSLGPPTCGAPSYEAYSGAQAGIFTQFCTSMGQWNTGTSCQDCGNLPDVPGQTGFGCAICGGVAQCWTADATNTCACP